MLKILYYDQGRETSGQWFEPVVSQPWQKTKLHIVENLVNVSRSLVFPCPEVSDLTFAAPTFWHSYLINQAISWANNNSINMKQVNCFHDFHCMPSILCGEKVQNLLLQSQDFKNNFS